MASIKTIKPLKPSKGLNKQAHTPNSPRAKFDMYGSGVRNPIGKKIDSYMDIAKSKDMKSSRGKKPTLA
jgi:hypothetical protein